MAVNIVKDYSWTAIPKGSQYRNEAPMALVRAYTLDKSQLQQFVLGYINLAQQSGQGGIDFYRSLYSGELKETYHFPYFNSDFRNFQNNFANTFSNISERGQGFIGKSIADDFGQLAENVAGGFATINEIQGFQSQKSPGSYIETPKFYQYENTDGPLTINFTLANTVERGDAEKNLQFIKDFTKLNRPERNGPIAMTFPAIYKVTVPGLRYIEWAYCSNINFELLGARRKIGNNIIPEAFGCSFSFKSLTLEPSNFIDEL